MGVCFSSKKGDSDKSKEDQKQSKDIQKAMTEQRQKEQEVIKLLLLGAGESGKSTLFKQMISIYGKGFSDEDRKEYVPIVHSNVMGAIKTLCEQLDELAGKISGSLKVHPSLEPSKQFVLETKETTEIDSKVAAHLAALWADQAIQNVYGHRSMYQLSDSTAYFLDKIQEVGRPGYIPNEQDVLRSRVRTTGIIENDFVIDGNRYKMLDVGGQRNERKKWMHCFSEVTSVIYVAALSEYDQVLYEDGETNRMTEALNLFDETANSKWFKKTAMILMLNKRDIFAEKVKVVSLKQYFKDFPGPDHDYDAGVAFIQGLFLARYKAADKPIYTHITCATDTNHMKVVFDAVKDIVIRISLRDGGLLT